MGRPPGFSLSLFFFHVPLPFEVFFFFFFFLNNWVETHFFIGSPRIGVFSCPLKRPKKVFGRASLPRAPFHVSCFCPPKRRDGRLDLETFHVSSLRGDQSPLFFVLRSAPSEVSLVFFPLFFHHGRFRGLFASFCKRSSFLGR